MKFYVSLLRLCFFLFITTLITPLQSQTCKATAPAQVSVGQAFHYSIELNEKASKIVSVHLNPFSVLGGPNQSYSSSTNFVNGQVTQNTSYTYSYTLRAAKTGTFTIPGATVAIGNKQVKSNAVTITVVDAQKSQTQQRGTSQTTQTSVNIDKNSVFVKAFLSNSNPYEGEEVIVTHKLYVSDQINGGYQVRGAIMPTQAGFWSYTLGDQSSQPTQKIETIDGKRYNVIEIRKIALYPQKSGTLSISPLEVDFVGRVIYRVQSNNIWDDFFGGGQRSQDIELNLKSNSLSLHVKKLPENNQPDDFSGLVGQFELKANVSRTELQANDALNLTITLSGSGNLQHADKLQITFPADFDVTEPKINDNIHTSGNRVHGSRTFEYVLIPRTEGTFTIEPAIFSFFDIKSKTYKTLETEGFTIQVTKGNDEVGNVVLTSHKRDLKILGNDIRFIKTEGKIFYPKRELFFLTPLFFALLLSPLLLLVVFIFVWRKKIEERKNIALIKNRRANKVAKKRLKHAAKLLISKKKEQFYIEISQVLWGYMSDKFHIPLAQLSMETVSDRLKGKNIDEESIKEFITTLDNCEFARFAPGDSTEMMQQLYDLSLQFITKIEKKS